MLAKLAAAVTILHSVLISGPLVRNLQCTALLKGARRRACKKQSGFPCNVSIDKIAGIVG